MRQICEVLCIAGILAGCGVSDDPVEGVSAKAKPSVTTPTPPATGVDPCSGWPGGLFGAMATFARGDAVVTFHGGSWTVPLAVRPGQSLSDVAFTIEAPTGHAGDPTSVRVGLYSNGNPLSFATLTPFGLGARVNGDIPMGGRIVASGEVLALEFVPLDATGGGYAANDTVIDGVSVSSAISYARPTWPAIRFGASSQSEAADPIAGSGHLPVRRFNVGASIYAEIPFNEGEMITGFSMELAGDGLVDGSLEIVYGTRGGGQFQIGTLTNFTNVPASWGVFRTSLFAPTVLAGDGQLSLVLTANTPNLYWGYITPVFSR